MAGKIDLTGKQFSKLMVIKENGKKNGAIAWECICDCGNITVVNGASLRGGNTNSCGCLIKENNINNPNRSLHNMAKTEEYTKWSKIKARCYNKKLKQYKDYGGRGIIMCAEWKDSFEQFYKDMGPKPFKEAQIDRINNDGNYEPSNCRWVTKKENCNNRRSSVLITYDYITLSISDWAEKLNIKYSTLYMRLRTGWTFEDCIIGKRTSNE